ncbi:871_t:CDS:2, partial [Entrophospora sp. SA101]
MSSKTHKAKENLYENKQQRTLDASLSSSESKENEWAIHCGSTLNIEVALEYLDEIEINNGLNTDKRKNLYNIFIEYLNNLNREHAQQVFKFICGNIHIPPKFPIS